MADYLLSCPNCGTVNTISAVDAIPHWVCSFCGNDYYTCLRTEVDAQGDDIPIPPDQCITETTFEVTP